MQPDRFCDLGGMPFPAYAAGDWLGIIAFDFTQDVEHRITTDVILRNKPPIRQLFAPLNTYDDLLVKRDPGRQAGFVKGVRAINSHSEKHVGFVGDPADGDASSNENCILDEV